MHLASFIRLSFNFINLMTQFLKWGNWWVSPLFKTVCELCRLLLGEESETAPVPFKAHVMDFNTMASPLQPRGNKGIKSTASHFKWFTIDLSNQDFNAYHFVTNGTFLYLHWPSINSYWYVKVLVSQWHWPRYLCSFTLTIQQLTQYHYLS